MKHFNLSYIFIAINICYGSLAVAQRNSEKADRYFNQNQFESAIKYYLMDANSDNKKAKEYAMAKLAYCYRITGEFEKAEEIYKKILKRKKTVPDNYLNYALSLKSSAKYAEAKLQFEEYIKLKPDDPMGNIYLQSCDSAQKWLDETIGKEVKNIESINTDYSEFSPYLYKNELYFSSSRNGSTQAMISFDGGGDMHRMDLYHLAINKLVSKAFTEKEVLKVNNVNTPMHEGTPTFSADGNEMYFSKTIKGKKNEKNNKVLNTLQIFYTKKDSVGNWIKPVSAFLFNSANYSVAHPSLTKDGSRIYFMSDMPGGFGKTDIYYSNKNTDGSWSKPINVGNKVNTFGYELFPTITANNELYFSSNAHPGMGQLDVFKSELIDGKWDKVQNIKPPINSIGNDFGICFNEEGTRGFFSSDRFNGKGAEDIYSFVLETLIDVEITDDIILVHNNFIFDDIKFKFTNLRDSSTQETSVNDALHKLATVAGNTYAIAAKKNGIPLGKIEITKNVDGYDIKPFDISVQLSGKVNKSIKSIKIVSNLNSNEEIHNNSNDSFRKLQSIKSNEECRVLFLKKN